MYICIYLYVMAIKFNNLTSVENKIANDFFEIAENCFLKEDRHQLFSNFFNIFNSACNNKTYDPNQYIMGFAEEKAESFTEEENSLINEFKKELLLNRNQNQKL